jgi:hypothetical protein
MGLLRLVANALSPARWPLRLWETVDVEGLRWRENSSTYRILAWDSVTVGREVESWRRFGSYGKDVPEVLEGIWRLTQETVGTYGLPAPYV